MSSFVSRPCKACPFRKDVVPYLHPDRAAEIAAAACSLYSDFTCHRTFEYDGGEDHQGRPTGDFSKARTCAGFLSLRAAVTDDAPDGFTPDTDGCYQSPDAMIQAYAEQWRKTDN